jgi:hypothetical protein
VIGEPLAHTLARIGGGLFGATILLFLMVVWMADIRGATGYSPQLKKWRSRWRVALFLGFGAVCMAFALIPTRVPTTAYTRARAGGCPVLPGVRLLLYRVCRLGRYRTAKITCVVARSAEVA